MAEFETVLCLNYFFLDIWVLRETGFGGTVDVALVVFIVVWERLETGISKI